MKARLAKKLCRTPWNELPPRWLHQWLKNDKKCPTIAEALRMYGKLKKKQNK